MGTMDDIQIEIQPSLAEISRFDGLQIDPDRHQILADGEYVKLLQKRLDLPGLFIYRHKITKKFVLACWINKDYGVCRELEILEGPPGRGHCLPTPEYMERRTRPVIEQRMEKARQVREARTLERDLEMDSEYERADKVKHLRRQGMTDSADVLESGIPFTGKKEGGENLEQVKASLNEAKKAHWQGS